MKVILLEDIAGAGKAGEVVEVANGYARNKLLPSGVAIEANKTNMKTLEHRRAKIAAKKAVDKDIAQDLAVRIEGKQVDFIAKAGDAGKLFGSVTAQDIADAVKATFGFEIDRRKLLLDSPLKQIGMHEVRYRVYPEVEPTIMVNILAEGYTPAPTEEIEIVEAGAVEEAEAEEEEAEVEEAEVEVEEAEAEVEEEAVEAEEETEEIEPEAEADEEEEA
jgi:large subunit ribosomal protein L9